MSKPEDVFELLRKIRYDCTSIQAKVTDALNALNDLDLPSTPDLMCDRCGLPFRGRLSLEEHIYVSHEGPVPAHWLAIEARSEEPAEVA